MIETEIEVKKFVFTHRVNATSLHRFAANRRSTDYSRLNGNLLPVSGVFKQ
jgi:hypothetical protein